MDVGTGAFILNGAGRLFVGTFESIREVEQGNKITPVMVFAHHSRARRPWLASMHPRSEIRWDVCVFMACASASCLLGIIGEMENADADRCAVWYRDPST